MTCSHTGMFRSAQEVAADIARELREHPDHWFQGSLVKLADGSENDEPWDATRDDAICWCLEGHIVRRTKIDPEYGIDRDVVFSAFRLALGESELYAWNDRNGRSVADVIALAERVAHKSDDLGSKQP